MQCVINATAMSLHYIKATLPSMRQLGRNVFSLYANDTTQLCLFGDRNFAKLYERMALREFPNATAVSLKYNHLRLAAIAL